MSFIIIDREKVAIEKPATYCPKYAIFYNKL